MFNDEKEPSTNFSEAQMPFLIDHISFDNSERVQFNNEITLLIILIRITL
jgi:hypothetical protein